MKPVVIKTLSIKAFGKKEALAELEKVLEDNFTVAKFGVLYCPTHDNYEQWFAIFAQEEEP